VTGKEMKKTLLLLALMLAFCVSVTSQGANSAAPPSCNQAHARASWDRIAGLLHERFGSE